MKYDWQAKETERRDALLKEIDSLTLGDTAYVWMSSYSGGRDYTVKVVGIGPDRIAVKDMGEKPRRFRPFMRKRDYTQLSGSGRATQTLSLRGITRRQSQGTLNQSGKEKEAS